MTYLEQLRKTDEFVEFEKVQYLVFLIIEIAFAFLTVYAVILICKFPTDNLGVIFEVLLATPC